MAILDVEVAKKYMKEQIRARAELEKINRGDMRPLEVPLVIPIQHHPGYPNLAMEGYANDNLFLKINTEFPGLQVRCDGVNIGVVCMAAMRAVDHRLPSVPPLPNASMVMRLVICTIVR